MEIISTRVDNELHKRVQRVAVSKNLTISDCARKLIEMGLYFEEGVAEWLVKLSDFEAKIRPAIEEVLISLFGIETLVVKTYMEPVQLQKLGRKAREEIVKRADDRARSIAKKLLNGEKIDE